MPSIRATPKALVVLKTLKRIEIGQASGTHTMQILYVRERFFLYQIGGLVTFFFALEFIRENQHHPIPTLVGCECKCSFFGKPAAPERIRHTPLVAAKYNRQNRTVNPLERGGGAGQPGGRCILFANVVFLKGKLTAPVGTGTHHTSSNEIQPAEQNTGNPLEVGGKEGDGAPCRGLLRRGCSRARCLRSEHCSLPNGLFLQLVVTVYSCNACSAFLNEDCCCDPSSFC